MMITLTSALNHATLYLYPHEVYEANQRYKIVWHMFKNIRKVQSLWSARVCKKRQNRIF